MDELGLAPLTGIAAALATMVVAGVDAFKVYVLKGWTKKVPAVIWYLLVIGIPVAVCVYFGLDWFDQLAGDEIPPSLEPFSTAATGVMVGLGASITYKGKETAKALAAAKLLAEGKPVPSTLTPPGEPGIPAPCPVPAAGVVTEPEPPVSAPVPIPALAPATPRVREFIELWSGSGGPDRFILVEDEKGSHLLPLS